MSDEKENKALDEKDQDDKSQENKEAQKNQLENKKVIDKKTDSTNKSKPTSKLSFVLSVMLLIIFSIAFIFIMNRLNNIENEFKQSNVENNSSVQDSEIQIKESLSRFSGIEQKLTELESKQEVLAHSYSQPVEQQIHINKDYALAEIEHLLIIANYNLKLDHNVATALSAMESADARLTGLTDPAVLSVREQLIADMNELRSLNQADLSGLAFSLSDFISRVDDLALKENVVLESEEKIAVKDDEPVEGVKHFFALVLKELKSLIVITRDKDVGKPRLLPDEVYFLRANLKLELANARFAVFNRDTENLHASVNHIQGWLDEYFDLSDADVRNIYDSLSKIKKMELSFPKLDISSSLESVRALSHYQDEVDNDIVEEELMPLQ